MILKITRGFNLSAYICFINMYLIENNMKRTKFGIDSLSLERKKQILKNRRIKSYDLTVSIDIDLTWKERVFVIEYIFDWNAKRSAIAAGYSESRAAQTGMHLLKRPNIQSAIKQYQQELEKVAGISRLQVLREHMKIAFSSIAHIHNSWLTKKEFDELSPEQKDCIAEIDTKVRRIEGKKGQITYIEMIKVKLYDKQKALQDISRMLGYDEPQEINVNTNGQIVHRHEDVEDYLSDLNNNELSALQKIGFDKLGLPKYADN